MSLRDQNEAILIRELISNNPNAPVSKYLRAWVEDVLDNGIVDEKHRTAYIRNEIATLYRHGYISKEGVITTISEGSGLRTKSGTPEQIVLDTMVKSGLSEIDSAILLAIEGNINADGSLRATVGPPNTSAYGIGQFIRKTWNAYAKQAGVRTYSESEWESGKRAKRAFGPADLNDWVKVWPLHARGAYKLGIRDGRNFYAYHHEGGGAYKLHGLTRAHRNASGAARDYIMKGVVSKSINDMATRLIARARGVGSSALPKSQRPNTVKVTVRADEYTVHNTHKIIDSSQITKNAKKYGYICVSGVGPRHGRNHNGVDIQVIGRGGQNNRAATFQKPIVAYTSGKIILAKSRTHGGEHSGNYIKVVFDDNPMVEYTFMHLDSFRAAGKFTQGTVLGRAGHTGASGRTHFHIEKRVSGAISVLTWGELVTLCGKQA